MGFFDRFKKKENIGPTGNNRQQQAEQLPSDIKYSATYNGDLKVEFYDRQSDFKKFYDTTRLIVSKQPMNIAGHKVYKCAVSWYEQSDCQILDEKTGEFDSPGARERREVLAEIDLDLLQNDPNYCNRVMKVLMDMQRVERYLKDGLQDSPKLPCGKYIGGVKGTEKDYGKFFSSSVGEASHNSELMVNRRQECKEMIEASRQRGMAKKEDQIRRLRNELNDMQER